MRRRQCDSSGGSRRRWVGGFTRERERERATRERSMASRLPCLALPVRLTSGVQVRQKHMPIPRKQYAVDEDDDEPTRYSRNGTITYSSSGGRCDLYGNGDSASHKCSDSGKYANSKKSKSEYLYRKTVPVASPEADDEDEEYNSNRDQRSWEKYCQLNSKPTSGMAPSRIQWEYRKGVKPDTEAFL
ncbi:hypothetical protein C0J52_11936 [Blattella germanica]|nr:hypothetical protein C0J52_11936 [Blattella germanica]